MMNLFKALSYKEWIKTRRVLGVLVVLALAALAYTFIDVTHSIRLDEAVNAWYGYLFLGKQLPAVILLFSPLAGLALSLVQFIPEMTNKRLKLTLHLPADETSIVSSMLLYGYLVLAVLFAFLILILVATLSLVLPREIIQSFLQTLLPWFVSGWIVYGFSAWICFEPQWKQRIFNLLIGLALLSILFVSQTSGAYLHFGWGLFVLLVASFVFPFYSAVRFKHGVL